MNARVEALLREARAVGWVMEPAAREILASYAVPVGRHLVATRWEEAIAGAASLGWPLVAKVVSPEIVHKADVGGVIVGITGEAALRAAWDHLSALPAFAGVLLDEQHTMGVELIVGVKIDPAFGPVVMVGLGGTAVELYRDVSIRMAPLSLESAREALAALKAFPLLTGYRGGQAVDLDALVELLLAVSEAAMALEDAVESLDLNPVFASASGAVVADARLILR
ncbi:MAG: acetate--CoA ligase family protein [Deltaproteobacteria bacterium]|nr:acetate--CoA ligase family protein [Deltaproteobacteria bacterium]